MVSFIIFSIKAIFSGHVVLVIVFLRRVKITRNKNIKIDLLSG